MTAAPSLHAAGAAPTLGHDDYLRFRKLAQDRFGLRFSENRRADLERGVWQAFAASTCANLEEYYRLLQDPGSSAVHAERLVNVLTVSESHFFRNAAQFEALQAHVLPQIIERQRALRTLRIWSAGCANGEEPYSIAILLRELLPDADEWAITILATDVNTEALGRAREATYSNWAFREVRAKERRSRYFHKRGNHYKLIPEVRRMVTFTWLNLAVDDYPAYETNTMSLNLILCRNVAIYFAELVTRRMIERFQEALVDGGWLVVGHSEHSLVHQRRFQAHSYPGAILYQRTGQPLELPRDWLVEPATTPAAISMPAPKPKPVDVQTVFQPPPAVDADSSEDGNPVERARELLSYGHSEQARDMLLELAESGFHDASTYAPLGQAYANLGHWEEAKRWCRKAVDADRLALEAYYTLALVLQHQGRLEEAIDAMKKVVYINRRHVLGHFVLADLYHASGRLPRALKSLDNARRLLNGQAGDALVPGADGITVGRLMATVVRQQQQWSVEASG